MSDSMRPKAGDYIPPCMDADNPGPHVPTHVRCGRCGRLDVIPDGSRRAVTESLGLSGYLQVIPPKPEVEEVNFDAPIDLTDAIERVRSLVRSEAGRIAYFDDELDRLVTIARRTPSGEGWQQRIAAAISAVTRQVAGAQRIKVEADPLYGIKAHERWYPKATLVDTDALMELHEAWQNAKDATPPASENQR